jgi:hypothetical protein
MVVRHQFADDQTVCSVLDVTTSIGEISTQTVVHLAEVVEGRIARIEVVFDASQYHRMFSL